MASRILLQQSLRQQLSMSSCPLASRHWTNATQQFHGFHKLRRTFFSFADRGSKKQLKRIEQDANMNPEDPSRQLKFLQALNKDYPGLVIRRVEEGRFAMSQEAYREYIKALVRTNRFDTMDTNLLYARMQAAAPIGTGHAATAATVGSSNLSPHSMQPEHPRATTMTTWQSSPSTASIASGLLSQQSSAAAAASTPTGLTPMEPMYVSMVDGGFKKNMWKTIRAIVLGFMVISAGVSLVDEKGLGGVGGKSKMTAATGSDKTFDDVKGCDEAKEELEEIVQYLKVRCVLMCEKERHSRWIFLLLRIIIIIITIMTMAS
jgi:ATP-dependent metalloprotease